ncbi:unnamed protein product [Callosobruchus maculatus]|uniref:Reverse transcriptase domain-containing protein n=1 Tax=Callosobruchus maculatus TaxID=64391 RepID=A0A653C3H7_CALMS|nr:unnamed protein product [Callosobruchus maculatus]
MVHQSAEEALGYREEKRKDWITDRTWNLIKQRKDKKGELNKDKSVTERNQLIQEYNQLNKEVRNSARHDKRKWAESVAERAEEAAAINNMKELYKSTKTLTRKGHATDRPLKSKNGELLTSAEEQVKRWHEYYEELMNCDQNNDIIDEVTRNYIVGIDTSEPTRDELKEAVKNMRNNKSPGIDDIPSELWKADVEKTLDLILPLIKDVWVQEVLPTEWNNGIIIKIPKKGDLKDCCNWRGVTLLCSINKILAFVIHQRIHRKVEEQLRKEQAGFRKGKSCVDQIATARIIIEQTLEMNSKLIMCVTSELCNSIVGRKRLEVFFSDFVPFLIEFIWDESAIR